MDIKNMNIWKTKTIKEDESTTIKIDSLRLSQFEESGYRLKNLGEWLFIEKLGSQLVTSCNSIEEAEQIINLAMQLEKKQAINIEPKPRRHILSKAQILTGK